jgi:2-C-methyl-D-erythritol 4-phosphate cytidylyltransferase
MKTSAIIAGGGSGKRMQSRDNKLFIEIGAMPILAMTVAVFESADLIDEIVITVPADEIGRANDLVKKHAFRKVSRVIAGGPTRQASVFNGLQAMSADTDIVAIHDGARPFITREIIAMAVKEAKACGAVIVGVPAKDTIKTVDEKGLVTKTLDREFLWHAQTPQVFDAALIKEAHERAGKIGLESTDDSGLVERLGGSVRIVQGSYENIKITTPEDIRTAEAILLSRK